MIIRTGIKLLMSSNSGHIHPVTSELPALDHRKKCCEHVSASSFNQIFFKLADNEGRHKILDEFDFGTDQTFRFQVNSKKFSHIDLQWRKCCGSNLNSSEASWQSLIKFYMKHHLGGGKSCIRFWGRLYQNSTATKISHRLIIGKTLWTR